MKKLANLFLMLAILGLPIACGGGADFDVPPVTEVPQNPPSNNPPSDDTNDLPPLVPVETPEVHHHHPELAPDGPPQVFKKPDWELSIATPNPAQINPCLIDPEAEGC